MTPLLSTLLGDEVACTCGDAGVAAARRAGGREGEEGGRKGEREEGGRDGLRCKRHIEGNAHALGRGGRDGEERQLIGR